MGSSALPCDCRTSRKWKYEGAAVVLALYSAVAYSLRNLRTAKEIRSVLGPLVAKEICENRAEVACFQAVEPRK